VDEFGAGLRELGYMEGRDAVLEYRWAEGKLDRLPILAAELVHLKVNVIVAGGIPAVRAARQATGTIPIVVWAAGDLLHVPRPSFALQRRPRDTCRYSSAWWTSAKRKTWPARSTNCAAREQTR
jgi:ABC transporter substrate binding protein